MRNPPALLDQEFGPYRLREALAREGWAWSTSRTGGLGSLAAIKILRTRGSHRIGGNASPASSGRSRSSIIPDRAALRCKHPPRRDSLVRHGVREGVL